MKKLILFCVLLSVAMFGCGSGKDTAGTLTMSEVTTTALSGSQTYLVGALATYAANAGKDTTGAEISFKAVYYTASNSTPFLTKTVNKTLGKDGIAKYSGTVDQSSDTIILRLTASFGDLSETKYASIPAIGTLAASPSSHTFASTDLAGATTEVVVSGGFPPFTVSSSTTDIDASISGSSITITKVPGGTTTASKATVTVTDSKGYSTKINIVYYK
jgi:hypothetical protein